MTDMNVKLLLSAVDRMSPALAAAARSAQAFGAKFSGSSGFGLVAAAAANVGTQMRGVGAAAAEVGQRLALLGSAGGLIGGGLFAFVKTQIIDVAAQFERFEVQLTALEGSAEKARKALDWAKDFAQRTPLELTQVIDAYAKLRAFGLDPTDGTLQALADTMAKQGRGAEDLNGIILQLGQAWQKGKLQQEDMIPLIERGVPVMELLSRATGKTAAQLQEMSSKGKLGRDAIRALIREAGKDSKGASEAFAKTWTGMLSMLSDAWTNFGQAIGRAGVFDFVKGRLAGLLSTIDQMSASGELQRLAETISGKLVDGLQEAWSAFRDFVGAAQDGWVMLKGVKDFFGSWTPILGAVAAVIAGPLIASVASLTASMVTLGVAIGATPFGWLLVVLAGVTAAGVTLWRNWDDVTKRLVGAWEWAKGALVAIWSGIVSAVQPLVNAVSGAIGVVGRFVGASADTGTSSAAAPAPSAVSAAAAAQKWTGSLGIEVRAPKGTTHVTKAQTSGGVDMDVYLGPLGVTP